MSMTLHSQTVNVDRKRLLIALKANMKKHVQAYEQAVKDYRLALQGDLEEALAKAKDESFNVRKIEVDFNHPTSYASQYQQAIDMLEESVDKSINLDSSAFQAYMKDQWHWSSSFSTSNSVYSTKALSVSGRTGSVDLGGLVGNLGNVSAGSTVAARASQVRKQQAKRRGQK